MLTSTLTGVGYMTFLKINQTTQTSHSLDRTVAHFGGPLQCRARDYYHTCYCLSGLAAAQWCHAASLEDLPQPRHVLGPYSNLLVSGGRVGFRGLARSNHAVEMYIVAG